MEKLAYLSITEDMLASLSTLKNNALLQYGEDSLLTCNGGARTAFALLFMLLVLLFSFFLDGFKRFLLWFGQNKSKQEAAYTDAARDTHRSRQFERGVSEQEWEEERANERSKLAETN